MTSHCLCAVMPTPQSRGCHAASRMPPLTSNVEALKKTSGTTFAVHLAKKIATMARYKPQDHKTLSLSVASPATQSTGWQPVEPASSPSGTKWCATRNGR